VVHCHDWISSLYLFIASQGIKNIKKIITIHSQGQGWHDMAVPYILKKMDLIICVSKTQKLSLFERGIFWEKMKVIHNCFNSNKFRLSKNYNHAKGDGVFRVVMVGNFYWQKDQQTLIRAINIIRNQEFKIELHLVGDSNKRLFVQNQLLVKKLNLNLIVFFYKNKRVDRSFLLKFDLFAFSTKSERMPIAPLEAMACSLPVLVSDIPSNMELIRYGLDGFFFETGNSHDCADKIIEIIKNLGAFQRKRKYGYRRSQDFVPKLIVNRLENCYKNILDT
jgi:glycosyltransferase involved in cell wall biosynthesis